MEEDFAFGRRYAMRRRLTEAGVGRREPGDPSTSAERAVIIAAARAKYGSAPRRAPVARSLPSHSIDLGRHVRRALGNPKGVRQCGHSGCRVININHEGPADVYCADHR